MSSHVWKQHGVSTDTKLHLSFEPLQKGQETPASTFQKWFPAKITFLAGCRGDPGVLLLPGQAGLRPSKFPVLVSQVTDHGGRDAHDGATQCPVQGVSSPGLLLQASANPSLRPLPADYPAHAPP